MWAKIGEFKSTELHRYFLKTIWDPRKNSVVSEISLYQGALYQGPSVFGTFEGGTPCHLWVGKIFIMSVDSSIEDLPKYINQISLT